MATRAAVETGGAQFDALVGRLGQLRGVRGRPSLWRTLGHTDEDLAAATFYHLARSRIWAQGSNLPPRLSTVARNIGVDLLPTGTDDKTCIQIGAQLLGKAEHERIVELLEDARGGKYVRLTDDTFDFFKRIVDPAARHVLRRIRTHRPVGIETKKPHEMRIPRPDVPLRVVEAAEKIQGTAWRINKAVLRHLQDIEIAHELGGKDSVSLTREQKTIIAEAGKLTELERFYFPAHLDFRGRLYQDGGLLTFTGGDYARGLLEFADGEFVDDNGMKWLTWHMAQMWGHKKDWPTSADGKPYLPLGDGTAWLRKGSELVSRWREAKHPVQFLAAALAVVDASEGRPVHLPVRVDASCSGLQHLALLARDTDLAKSVNLWGDYHGDRRGMAWLEIPKEDFYTCVLEATKLKDRDEVKAVIVPMLYTAGPDTSAVDLAHERRGENARPNEKDKRDVRRIRAAAEQLAPRAFALLRWFGKAAQAHCKDEPAAIRWTTPSGFEAIQDYRHVEENPKRPDRRVKLLFNGRTMDLVQRFYTSIIESQQQGISLPSSIVHSLDASLLTEIVAASGIDQWGVVHDAFHVPANRVWDLLQANEDAMRAMYTTDWLATWISEWRAAGIDAPDPPPYDARLPDEMLGGLRTLG